MAPASMDCPSCRSLPTSIMPYPLSSIAATGPFGPQGVRTTCANLLPAPHARRSLAPTRQARIPVAPAARLAIPHGMSATSASPLNQPATETKGRPWNT